MKLAELALALGADLHGDGDAEITGVAGLEEAGPEEVTFVANPRYSALARTTNAGAVLVTLDFPEIQTPTLRTANPYLAFAKAVQIFYREPVYSPGIHTTAVVHPTARIGREAHIGAFAVVSEGVDHRRPRHTAAACGHLSLRQRRRQFLRPCALGCPRVLPDR